MSIYNFIPSKPKPPAHELFVTWTDALSDEDVVKLEEYVNSSITLQPAVIGDNQVVESYRRSKVGWIEWNSQTSWLYDRLSYISRSINGDYYNFDLFGFVEHFQYTVYEDTDIGIYDWHFDSSSSSEVTRKLSLVIQLSDPSDYEGGELEINNGHEILKVDKRKGMLAAFPSFILHRVTPVTKGTRKSLVVWIGGPAFK